MRIAFFDPGHLPPVHCTFQCTHVFIARSACPETEFSDKGAERLSSATSRTVYQSNRFIGSCPVFSILLAHSYISGCYANQTTHFQLRSRSPRLQGRLSNFWSKPMTPPAVLSLQLSSRLSHFQPILLDVTLYPVSTPCSADPGH